jgi:catechol 2,3-dioxygenase-like lactoylglutathione lyase family enzyme
MTGSLTRLGEIMQLAFVPSDFDGAIAHWLKAGAGPFFVLRNATFKEVAFNGCPTDVVLTVAFGYWGDMQIEIMRQENDTPSVYTRWRAAGREGLHHVAVLVDDVDTAKAECAKAGAKIVLDATPPAGGAVIYAELTPNEPFVEFITGTPERRKFYNSMRDAHRDWDGSDPIRFVN